MPRIAAAIAFVLTSTAAWGQAAPDIRGVWRPVSRTIPADPKPGGRSDPFGHVPAGVQTNLQPGLLIFTARHYSRTTDTATSPRPATPDAVPGTPSLDELRARWGPFQANAGTYELSGHSLTLRIVVSKNPAEQHTGGFARIAVRLERDRLWLTPVENTGGRIAAGVTTEYVRVE
jgi:hypothetical protein